ncbi:unnamed protein product [Orchesella dallaii]|uniref:Uncharacterized protein n=1 Tax=Orchesella dallaii TaxID=48710 RepID=A0ABP1S307_9HEXA
MVKFQIVSVCLAAIIAVQGQAPSFLSSRPRPNGSPSLGAVMPGLSGWGGGWAVPTTVPPTVAPTGWPSTPPPTTGWPSTPPPTTGWPSTLQTTTAPPPTGWPSTPPPPTGWPSTPPPTTGWPSTDPPPTGWPAPPTGWPAPQPGWSAAVGPVDIVLVGESAVLGAGEAGATHGSQTVVSGDATNPAIATIQTGSSSSLYQGSGIVQLSNIAANGESNTLQAIDGYNAADGTEYFAAAAQGNNINTVSGGASFVVGEGAIGQGGITSNSSPGVPYPGWTPIGK